MMRDARRTPIEHPDCFRFDFETSEDNTSVNIGSWTYSRIDKVILDGSEMPRVNSGGALRVTVPNKGAHVLYIRVFTELASNYFLSFALNCSYVRLPYNTSDMIKGLIGTGSWGIKWDRIDILDTNYIIQVKTDWYATFGRANIIRVPIGSKQLYADAGLSSATLDKIVEHNFYFKTA